MTKKWTKSDHLTVYDTLRFCLIKLFKYNLLSRTFICKVFINRVFNKKKLVV